MQYTLEYHNGMLLSHKKEQNFAVCRNTEGLGGLYTKWNKSVKEKYCMISHIYESKKIQQTVNITRSRLADIDRTNKWFPVGVGGGEM